VTAGQQAAAPTRAAAPAERWALVRASDWDINGQRARVMPYRNSTAAGRSAGAQNRHMRGNGFPDAALLLVLRNRGNGWGVAYDPRSTAVGAR
jgi:hypothetical protein